MGSGETSRARQVGAAQPCPAGAAKGFRDPPSGGDCSGPPSWKRPRPPLRRETPPRTSGFALSTAAARPLEEGFAAERLLLAKNRKESESLIVRAKAELNARAEDLQVRAAAVEETRRATAESHRETQEARLACEEIWVQLCGAMAPAALHESLARTRGRLDAAYRLQRQDVEEQARELRTLEKRICRQHADLDRARRDFQLWSDERQTQLVADAQRVVERERELRRREEEMETARLTWEQEKLELQHAAQRTRAA